MTLLEIMNRALLRLDEDPADLAEFEQQFRMYANEGYEIAQREYYKPRSEFSLFTDERGCASLETEIVRVVSLRRLNNGMPVRWSLDETGECIHTGEKNAVLLAVCEVAYPELDRGLDEPKLPEHVHSALVDYICYQHLSSGNLGKQQKAQFYRQNFYEKMRALRPQGMGSVTAYKNLYASTGLV